MKKTIILISVFFSFSFVFSQSRENSLESNADRFTRVFIGDKSRIPDGAEGSPYTKEEFSSAIINDSEVVYLVRYNAHRDLMEFKDKTSETFLLDIKADNIIKFNDNSGKVYHTVKYDNKRGYAIFLWTNSSNDLSLYTKENVVFTDGRKAKSSYEKDTPPKFTKLKNSYFIKTKGESMDKLATKKKSFFAIFKGKEKEIQQFVKKEKLKINKQKDLIEIVTYYDKLIN